MNQIAKRKIKPGETPDKKGQQEIEGTARPKIKALDEAMERYVDIRDRRMALTKQETAARDAIELHMTEAEIDTYRHTDGTYNATLKPTEFKVKVKKVSDEEEGEGGDGL